MQIVRSPWSTVFSAGTVTDEIQEVRVDAPRGQHSTGENAGTIEPTGERHFRSAPSRSPNAGWGIVDAQTS